jgi:predicted MFS family arabinose efflux permease
MTETSDSENADRLTAVPQDAGAARLLALFAALYFIQGISEPTEGLISQPTRSLLSDWGYSTATIASFMAALVLPWSIKPLYGLVTDFVPLRGTRRRSWLLLTTLVTALSLIGAYVFTPPESMAWLLLVLLFIPTIGIAFSDVVVDALMVDEGKPRGITGKIQSAQWTAIYAATILTGTLGGYLSERDQQELGFLIAGLAMLVSFFLVLVVVREPRRDDTGDGAGEHSRPLRETLRTAGSALLRTARQPGIVAIGAFIFLWNFNPFTSTVLQLHMVKQMGFSEQFYGNAVSIVAVGAMVASALYGTYCRRLRVGQLVYLSIVTGVMATVAYWAMSGVWSARIISFVVGFVYLTGMLVQLDLAARVCEAETAGTTFALLMSLSNFSVSLSTLLGGQIYDAVAPRTSYTFAFNTVVGIGALFTSCCVFLVPLLRRYCEPVAEVR